jgi:hypothetical protein
MFAHRAQWVSKFSGKLPVALLLELVDRSCLEYRWILETLASFLNTLSSFNVFAPLPTLSPNVLQNHFRLISGCCFHSMLQYVSPDAFELATSCSVNEASTSQSPFFWIKTTSGQQSWEADFLKPLSSPAGVAIVGRGPRYALAALAPVIQVAHAPAREIPCVGPRDFPVEVGGSHVAGRCVAVDSVGNADGSES